MKFRPKKILKITLISLASLIVLLTALVFSLQIPSVQNFVKDKLINYLEDKIQTEVSLERIYIDFPNSLVMENFFLAGEDVDTLLYVSSLDVGLDIPKLIQNRANITSIDLKKIRANVVRDQEGNFNFDYIINAFATDEEEESESKPFVINLDKIKLTDIDVSFIDHQSANDIHIGFKSFDTRVKKFDLDENTYAIGDINMDGLKLKLKQEIVKEVSQTIEENTVSIDEKPLNLTLKKIKLTNFDIDYGDENTQTYAKVLFENLETKINKLDLENNHYEIDYLKFKNADVLANLFLKETDANEAVQEEVDEFNPNLKEQQNEPMFVLLKQMSLDNVKVEYNNTAIAPTHSGMDFNHLKFSQLDLDLRDFKMKEDAFSGKVKNAEISEKSGLKINQFKTEFVYNDQEAILKDLHLETPNTLLRDKIELKYRSMEQLTEDIGSVLISANIKNSKVGFSDILLLAPDLRNTTPFDKYPNAVLHIDSKLNGLVDDLDIDHFTLSGLDDLKVKVKGKIKNATDPDKLYYDLNIQELAISSQTINNVVPKGTIPDNIQLPSQINLKGTAKGTTEIVQTKLAVNTSLGNIDLNADIDMSRENHETYTVDADLKNVQVGKIIKNEEVGALTGKLYVKGESFDPNLADAEFTADLNSFTFQDYTYTDVKASGRIHHGEYFVKADSNDPNAHLNLIASGHLNEEQPTIKVEGSIQRLDLQKLGFYDEPMVLAGNIDADFSNINPDELNGELILKDFAISDHENVFPLQDIHLTAINNETENLIDLNSQIADVKLSGKYKLTQIFDSLLGTLNEYYEFTTPEPNIEIDEGQHFVLDAKIKDDDLIRQFVPDLKEFDNISIQATYNADSKKIEMNGDIPFIQYGDNSIENGKLVITNQNQALQYNLDVDSVSNESFALNKIQIKGDVKDNILGYDISTRDEEDKRQFLIAGNLKSMGDITEISLNPNGLLLNYEDWHVESGNLIQISDKGIYADNFKISNGNSKISFQSEGEYANSPLNLKIDNFDIETITKFLDSKTLLASGTIDGTAQLRDIQTHLNLDSNIQISNLKVLENPVGNISIKVDGDANQLMNANVELSGNDNYAQLKGTYNSSSNIFDLVLGIDKFHMESIQGFTMNNLKDSEGYLSGSLKINGTPEKPNIKGEIDFNKVGFTIAETGSTFKNIDDAIYFNESGIEFRRFKISDNSGNFATINGQVLTKDYQDFGFNLDLRAKDFKLVDTDENLDAIMFGKLAVDVNLKIKGDLDLPKVDGTIKVTDATDFTFVLPQSSPQLQAREGIIEFIDQRHPELVKIEEDGEDLSDQSKIKGLDVNVNIETSKDAKMAVLIDKSNGDILKVQGEAELSAGIDPSGKINMTGVYEVEKGSYELSISLIKRKFDIQQGSTITWTEDPFSAVLDLTAIYKTNVSPIDLVQDQIAGLTSSEINMYKQQIPFETLLILEGELMKPEISFDITTDSSNPSVSPDVLSNVQTKLDQLSTDEAERNKQVFALLLLNRFVGENPFESESGMSAESMARQSVSALLSQQLNNLAGGLIKGVDIDFGLDSRDDYTTGEKNTRTDLNIDVSKRLLNDRLKVTVGSNFGVEGEARENENMTNLAGDVSLEYSLSKDGRYVLKAYRKDEYQVALQGQIIETGVGFIITLEYDKFKEIFEKRKRKKAFRQQDRANRRPNNQSNRSKRTTQS